MTQSSPGLQLTVQVPQWLGSVFKSAQALSQLVFPAEQLPVQPPLSQTWPAAQTFPHVPQFFGSDAVATQAPAQV